MKRYKLNLIGYIILSLSLVSCNPEQTATEFNETDLEEILSNEAVKEIAESSKEAEKDNSDTTSPNDNSQVDSDLKQCGLIDNSDICKSFSNCQPMFDQDLIFISCIDKESVFEEEEKENDDSVSDKEKDDIVDCMAIGCTAPESMPEIIEQPIESKDQEESREPATESQEQESQEQESQDEKECDKDKSAEQTPIQCTSLECLEVSPMPAPVDELPIISVVDESEEEDIPAEEDKECKGKNNIQICHIPPGNPAGAHTLCLPQQALQGHTHGVHAGTSNEDYEGACLKETLGTIDIVKHSKKNK